jgi:hypothetical protein
MHVARISTAISVIAMTAVSFAPAYAGQRGRGTPPATAHANTASKPANSKPADFAGRIASHPQLASRVQALLPPNVALQDAAAGFKNQGQFIAALHVSHNLGIPFDQLKAGMTGPNHESLGQAIHALKPGVDAKAATRVAEREADADEKAAAADMKTGNSK